MLPGIRAGWCAGVLTLAGAAAAVLLGSVSPAASQTPTMLPPAIVPPASRVESTFVPDAEAQLLAMLNRTREEHHLVLAAGDAIRGG
ncbi:MAG TPA: hypothetical protein VGZ23_06655 [bacterium]|nr:hypothetical protein [bacterium]